MIKFTLITNNPSLARYADACGVRRIFVDLEQIGKYERQGHLNTLISSHSMSDVAMIKSELSDAELLVRLNPLHSGTLGEVEAAIESGADLLMLPMFRNSDELRQFSELVDGRKAIVPLLETHSAAQEINEIVKVPGLSEIYIGLNDLHLDMKLDFMFEPLANGLVDSMVATIKAAGLPFGFGGIARVGEGIIPGELILAEHVRLGSSSVILSRTFNRQVGARAGPGIELDLEQELSKLFAIYEKLQLRSPAEVAEDQQKFQALVRQFIASKND